MSEFLIKLDSMKSLQDGWDSYKAPPPSLVAINNTKKFISCMNNLGWFPSRVSSSVVGGVGITCKSLNYNVNKKTAYFEFHNSGKLFVIMSIQDGNCIGEHLVDEIKGDNYEECIKEAAEYVGVKLSV